MGVNDVLAAGAAFAASLWCLVLLYVFGEPLPPRLRGAGYALVLGTVCAECCTLFLVIV